MKIHHLNICTMCPYGGRLVTGAQGGLLTAAELVLHAVLVETANDGLVLVDTGIGLDDMRTPRRRLGFGFVQFMRPQVGEEHTAARQIERLGFSRSDVRHIVCTHLDVDHAGGLPDFPDAKVHVHKKEHEAALAPKTFMEKERYKQVQWAHGPKWEVHEPGGDKWFGLDSVQAVADDVLMIPLPGHTRGHSAVAIRANDPVGPEWILHCGDAYFFHLEKEDPECCPPILRKFQETIAVDDTKRIANAKRIRDLHREHGRKVRVFSAHDPHEYRALAETERDRSGPLAP